MEEKDEKLIAFLVKDNTTLKQYMEKHQEYERQLEEFNRRAHLSPEESRERKKIQKLKLANRDMIGLILAEYRKNGNKLENREGLSPS